MKKVFKNGLVSLLVMLEGLSSSALAVETSKYNNISRMTPSFQIFHKLKKQDFSFEGDEFKIRVVDKDNNYRPTDGDLIIIKKEEKIYLANQKGAFLEETKYSSIDDVVNDINSRNQIYPDEGIIGYKKYQEIIDGVISDFVSMKDKVYVKKAEPENINVNNTSKKAVPKISSEQAPNNNVSKEENTYLTPKKEVTKQKSYQQIIQEKNRETLNQAEIKDVSNDLMNDLRGSADRTIEISIPDIRDRPFTFYLDYEREGNVDDSDVYKLANRVKDHLINLSTHTDSLYDNGDRVRFRYEKTNLFGSLDEFLFIEIPNKSSAKPKQRDYEVAIYNLNNMKIEGYVPFWEDMNEILKTRSGTIHSADRVIRAKNRLNYHLKNGMQKLLDKH